MNCIYFVIPCYNEQEVLPITAEQLRIKYDQLLQSGLIAESSRILLVDDGSKDRTWQIISQLHQKDSRFQGVKPSRSRGHQNALLAGLMTARSFCDAAISLDADLQDDINAMDAMLQKFQDGCDIVYGVRSDRETDTVFKRCTAQGYYKFMSGMGGELVYNHADYRLMSRRALDGLAEFGEVNLFLRGIVPMIGYRSDIVTYARKERPAGKSKYPLKKMLAFAWEGLTSLSIRPIRMITILGTLIFLVSIGMLIYSVIRHAMGATITGWTSLAVSIWAIGGLQLLAIGIIGEYIGKVYLETKSRPKYIIETYLGDSESK